MPEKFNSARRIRNILLAARAVGGTSTVLDAWSTALQTSNLPNSQFETYRLLHSLTEQVDSLAKEVEGLGLDESDYQPIFNNLNGILMVTNLDAQWGHYLGAITDEMIRQLGIFSQLSSVDEPIVPVEDIGKLKHDLLNFQSEVMQSDMDERLKALVLKQIGIILKAIREYPIRGERAFVDGDAALLATAISERDLIREHQGEEVVKKTISMWERMRELVSWLNVGINLTRVLPDVDPQKMLEAGSDMIDKLP